jgi:hypothetical protein
MKVSVKVYEVIRRAVEEGVAYGYQRAFKHTDTPSEETIKEQIEHAVMNAVSEVIDYDD